MVDAGLVYDLGGHTGQDTDFYLKRGFRVVVVEANPELVEALRVRFADALSAGTLHIVDAALSDRSGAGSFYKFDKSVYGTTSPDWTSRNVEMGGSYEEVEVRYTTLAEIYREHGAPYYMKIDIEGADMTCVHALKALERPSYLSIEVEKRDFDKFKADVRALEELGYRQFQLVQQELVPFARPPTPAREGRDVQHRFEFGSSGLFGRDLPDRWVDSATLIAAYEKTVRQHATFGDQGLGRTWIGRQVLRVLRLYPGWHDLHCRIGEPDGLQ